MNENKKTCLQEHKFDKCELHNHINTAEKL